MSSKSPATYGIAAKCGSIGFHLAATIQSNTISFAGLWEQFQWPDDTALRTFTIISANADTMMGTLYNRTLVIIMDRPMARSQCRSRQADD